MTGPVTMTAACAVVAFGWTRTSKEDAAITAELIRHQDGQRSFTRGEWQQWSAAYDNRRRTRGI